MNTCDGVLSGVPVLEVSTLHIPPLNLSMSDSGDRTLVIREK